MSSKMLRVLGVGAVVLVATATAMAYTGTVNVSARDRHWLPVSQALEWLRVRSIRTQAAGVSVPDNLDTPERVRAGVIHVEAHCRVCHGAPGEGPGELGEGMYPQPADLAQSARRYSPAELFWIVQNGIKMTGMPSWASHGDDELWSVVALLERLPAMTAPEYAALVDAINTETRKSEASRDAPAAPAPATPKAGHSHHGHQHSPGHRHSGH